MVISEGVHSGRPIVHGMMSMRDNCDGIHMFIGTSSRQASGVNWNRLGTIFVKEVKNDSTCAIQVSVKYVQLRMLTLGCFDSFVYCVA